MEHKAKSSRNFEPQTRLQHFTIAKLTFSTELLQSDQTRESNRERARESQTITFLQGQEGISRVIISPCHGVGITQPDNLLGARPNPVERTVNTEPQASPRISLQGVPAGKRAWLTIRGKRGPCTFHVSSLSASPLEEWCSECFGNWRERSSMVPKLRQHENFSASDFCIPGLVRIPNRTVMKASTPRRVFILTPARLERAAISGAQRKHTVPPSPLLSALTSRGPPCLHQYACTQCARTGLLAA